MHLRAATPSMLSPTPPLAMPRRRILRSSYSEILADSPTVFWTLSDSGSSALDISGSGIGTGTYSGTYTNGARQLGYFGAPYFNQGYVGLGGNSPLSTHAGASGVWSVDMWVYDDGGSNNRCILVCSNTVNFEFYMHRRTAGDIECAIYAYPATAIASVVSPSAAPVGRWYHLAVTFDRAASLMTLYIDGVSVATDTTMSGNTLYSATSWHLGARGDISTDRWIGSFSHFAMYPTCLTPGRVWAHYRAATP